MNNEDTFLDFSRISRSNTSPHIAKGTLLILLCSAENIKVKVLPKQLNKLYILKNIEPISLTDEKRCFKVVENLLKKIRTLS